MSLDARHKEALDFIKIKSQEGVVEKANLSLEIDDEFMKAAVDEIENGQIVLLHEDRDYSGHEVRYNVRPTDILHELAQNSWDWGDPAVLYTNRLRNYNLMQYDDEYQIETTNPCGW